MQFPILSGRKLILLLLAFKTSSLLKSPISVGRVVNLLFETSRCCRAVRWPNMPGKEFKQFRLIDRTVRCFNFASCTQLMESLDKSFASRSSFFKPVKPSIWSGTHWMELVLISRTLIKGEQSHTSSGIAFEDKISSL